MVRKFGRAVDVRVRSVDDRYRLRERVGIAAIFRRYPSTRNRELSGTSARHGYIAANDRDVDIVVAVVRRAGRIERDRLIAFNGLVTGTYDYRIRFVNHVNDLNARVGVAAIVGSGPCNRDYARISAARRENDIARDVHGIRAIVCGRRIAEVDVFDVFEVKVFAQDIESARTRDHGRNIVETEVQLNWIAKILQLR